MPKIPNSVVDLTTAREAMLVNMLLSEPMSPEHVTKAPNVVWHYTDAGGVRGIVGELELWATDALFMNDASELQLIQGLFHEMVLDFEFTNERLPDPGERRAVIQAFDGAISAFQEDPGVYAVCFCEDGDLLSQWNTYGRGGGGYSLGLDSKALAALDPAVVGELDFFQVIYDRYEQRIAVYRFVEVAINVIDLYFEHHPDKPRIEILNLAGECLAQLAQWFSARVKDAAFEQEREWRLIYRHKLDRNEVASYPREFRSTDRGLIPYVRLPLGDLHKKLRGEVFPLEEVKIGPTAREDLAARALSYLLKDSGFDITASSSKIPLRI